MNLGTHMPNGEKRKPIDIEKKFDTFFFRTISQVQESSTHMPQAERNTSHELEVVDQRSRSQFLKNRTEKNM